VSKEQDQHVTNNDLYEKIGKMDGKLDMLVAYLPGHSRRLRSLEAWRSKFLGYTAALAVVFAFFGWLITNAILYFK
jgi:hypothetical protein